MDKLKEKMTSDMEETVIAVRKKIREILSEGDLDSNDLDDLKDCYAILAHIHSMHGKDETPQRKL
ncbi:MAG: hypothetical protein NC112_05735 [Oxalobacter formigenes]|nr:hypothetical protein [Oxalobacter formigenes]